MSATATGVQVYIGATTADLHQGLQQAIAEVRNASSAMRTQLSRAGEGAEVASTGFRGLIQQAKTYRAEQVQQGRLVGFYVNELVQFTGAGKGAQQMWSGLASVLAEGLVGGIGFGVAIEGAKWLATYLQQAREQAEEARRAIVAISDAWENLRRSQIGASPAQKLLFDQTQAIEKDRTVLRLKEEIAAAQESLRQAEILTAGGAAGDWELEAARRELAAVEERLRQRRQELLDTAVTGARPALKAEVDEAEGERARKAAEVQAKARSQATEAGRTAEEAEEARRMRAAVAQAAMDVRNNELQVENVNALALARAASDGQAYLRAQELAEWWREFNAEVARVSTELTRRELETKAAMISQWGDRVGTVLSSAMLKGMSPLKAIGGLMKEVLDAVIGAAQKQIMATALAAAAEAAKSQAGVPVVGPLLAGGAMVAMLGMVRGLVGQLPSAAIGASIPAGVNPIMQLHEREIVTPARESQYLRDLARTRAFLPDGAPGPSAGSGAVVHANFPNVRGGGSARAWARDVAVEIQRELRELEREGR